MLNRTALNSSGASSGVLKSSFIKSLATLKPVSPPAHSSQRVDTTSNLVPSAETHPVPPGKGHPAPSVKSKLVPSATTCPASSAKTNFVEVANHTRMPSV